MANSQTSLVPRGFGRTAYHLVETLQMGLVPIYVYDDIPWVPYADLFEVRFTNHTTKRVHRKSTYVHLRQFFVAKAPLVKELGYVARVMELPVCLQHNTAALPPPFDTAHPCLEDPGLV